jgi:hypothetical protein
LWGKTLVEYGTRASEKRPMEVERYVASIDALEPDYKPLYMFGDTLLAYRPPRGFADDARKARLLLKRGTEVRPEDPDMWMHLGQFCAFMGRSFLEDPREIDAWSREGADAIMRAVELGADTDRSFSATSVMKRYGENDAAIKHLQRAWLLTDDDNAREQIKLRLDLLQANVAGEAAALGWDTARRAQAPHVPLPLYRLLGPLRRHRRAQQLKVRAQIR